MSEPKEKTAAKAQEAVDAISSPPFEVPVAMRELAETSVKRARETYDTCKSAAEEATASMENAFTAFNRGTAELQTRSLQSARQHVDAGFALAEKMLAAKSLSEVVELQGAFARSRMDSLADQARDFQSAALKVQADVSRPFRDSFSRAVTQWRRGI